MKIVIDITAEDFEKVKCGRGAVSMMRKAIIHGTPLPKEHGRLIDAIEYENSIRKHYFDNNTVIRCTEIALDNAPTIIEADKTESENNEDIPMEYFESGGI